MSCGMRLQMMQHERRQAKVREVSVFVIDYQLSSLLKHSSLFYYIHFYPQHSVKTNGR